VKTGRRSKSCFLSGRISDRNDQVLKADLRSSAVPNIISLLHVYPLPPQRLLHHPVKKGLVRPLAGGTPARLYPGVNRENAKPGEGQALRRIARLLAPYAGNQHEG
jgi:hypothetical protein